MAERRLLFGPVAEDYERARPGYPSAAVDDVLAFAGVGAGDDALEVGAGTGKATRAFLARGLRVTCIEPSAGMAAVLRRTCPEAVVEEVGFEDYRPPARGFRLLISAQAWHWVSADARRTRPREVLAAGGAVALLWNDYSLPEELHEAIVDVRRRVAPELLELDPPRNHDELDTGEELAAAGLVDVERRRYAGEESIAVADYVAVLGTASSHLLVPEERRRRLLDEQARVLTGLTGGRVTFPAGTDVWLARAPA